MERYRKAAVATLIIFFFFCTAVMFSEISLIPESQRTLFIVTKSLIVFACLPLAYLLHRNITSRPLNILVGVTFLAYGIHGQIFRPLYYLAFFQGVTMYSFLFPVSKKDFRVVVGIGTVLFLSVFYSHWDSYVEQSQHPVFSDIAFSVATVAIIGFLANTFFSSERSFREDALKKFSQIGLQSSRIVHDLKGLIAAPKLYVQILESKMAVSNEYDAQAVVALKHLSRDLENFGKVLLELNRLSAIGAHGSEKAIVDLSEVILSVQMLLRSQLNGIRVETSLGHEVKADRNLLSSVVMNLMMNSLDAFKCMNEEKRSKEPRVWIESLSQGGFRFRDNAGGFDQGVLDSIRQGKTISTRSGGSGLGLVFVHESIQQMGGKVKLYNDPEGACVELRLTSTV